MIRAFNFRPDVINSDKSGIIRFMSQKSVVDALNIKKVLQKAHSVLKSNVYLADIDGELRVVKDYSQSPVLIRETLCLFLRNREIVTLQKLAGIQGIPAYLGDIGPYAYKMQFVDGTAPTPETLATTEGLLSQLQTIIESIHKAGVTHNDTRPDNLIYSKEGQLYLIDFGAAMHRPAGNSLLSKPAHWLFNYLTKTDRSKVARLKQRYRPEELDETDKQLIEKTQFARVITKGWKKYVLPIISPGKHRKKF